MVDIHCHILPGVDDGSQSVEQSLRMAQLAVRSGVTAIVATPHTNIVRMFENYNSYRLSARFRTLKKALEKADIPLDIVKGAEIYFDGDVASMLKKGKISTINDSRYPLVEFSFSDHVPRVIASLNSLIDAGYTPIVAHPERYHFIHHDVSLLRTFIDMGCVLQINKGSPLGRFGDMPQKVSRWMLDQGLVHAVASDAHSEIQRTPNFNSIYDFLYDAYGDGCPRLLLDINPEHIINDEPIESVL